MKTECKGTPWIWTVLVVLAIAQNTIASGEIPRLKNFRQIFESLILATGVPGDTPEIAAYYNEGATRLPRTGVVGEVSAPMVMTFVSLSGLFCKEMISREVQIPAQLRRAHQEVNFTRGHADLTRRARESVIQNYAGLFWGREATNVESLQALSVLDGLGEARPSNPATMMEMLHILCTSMASSLESLVL